MEPGVGIGNYKYQTGVRFFDVTFLRTFQVSRFISHPFLRGKHNSKSSRKICDLGGGSVLI